MSEESASGGPDLGYVPQAAVAEKRRMSSIWIIPLLAVAIGAWLTWKAMSEQGPVITISFPTAEGLEAGNTKIKYRDLELGVVDEITLADDLSHVIVTAEMRAGTERYLTDRTSFWVVRARITAAGISGINTLLSGAYIGMDPVPEGKQQKQFKGLENPPLVTSRESGRLFVLRSRTLGALDPGVPVYYRKVPVGEVVRSELDPSGDFVSIDIFVRAPYHDRVRQDTRFWNASGFKATVGTAGVQIETTSFISMLIGGVAFETEDETLPPAEAGHVFHLYPNRDSTSEEVYTIKKRYLLHFETSVRGLNEGAAVEFRGIKIGQVADVRLEFDENDALRIPVVIEIEPERIGVGADAGAVSERLEGLVARGLRAQLRSSSLLTGALLISLDMHPNAEPAQVKLGDKYPELPTIPSPLDAIADNVSNVLVKLEAVLESIPVDRLSDEVARSLKSLRGTLGEAEKLAANVNSELVPALTKAIGEVEATLGETQRTMQGAQEMMGPESMVQVELKRMLIEAADAARSLRLLADHLERNPEDLIRGRSNP